MNDDFDDIEENSEENPYEYYELRHSPSNGYSHIQKSSATIESGLDEVENREARADAIAYSRVAVFRESMQYIEEFGIYLYSRLHSDEDFVDILIGTTPKKVKKCLKTSVIQIMIL